MLFIFIFVFSGCNQKQTVELKLPQKYQKAKKDVEIKKEKVPENDTVVEDFVPMDIKETNVSSPSK